MARPAKRSASVARLRTQSYRHVTLTTPEPPNPAAVQSLPDILGLCYMRACIGCANGTIICCLMNAFPS
jgi:hypothetical protein